MKNIKKARLEKIKYAAAVVIAAILLTVLAQEFFPGELSGFITGMSAAVTGEESRPNSTIAVAAIRMQKDDFSIDILKSKLGALFKAHPTIDLVVTPEYTFYNNYKSHPVIVNCMIEQCAVENIGSAKSLELQLAIKEIASIARQKNANIMLGTVAERGTYLNHGVVYDTLLVINSKGIIIGKSRKATEILLFEELLNPRFCSIYPSFCKSLKDPISASVLDSMGPFSLASAGGAEFTAVPVICADKDDENVISALSGSNADLIALSESASSEYINLVEEAEKGIDIFRKTDGSTLLIKRIFFQEYIKRGIIKLNSYLVASNSGVKGGSAGILSISRDEVRNLDITDDFVYGEITVDLPETIKENESLPFKESPAQVFDEGQDDNISEKAADNESQSKQEENELPKQGIFSRIKNFIFGIFS